ncbi:excinuclease ABC subunit UvrA [Acidaminobacter sp. JC074]|uniref:ATP-binding cassette domain-containing protein n=1 Tax=Acidaminobacter sp. JC074 TaxID=2530199 RepID=UPI001F10BA34|nr:excinuclease ABC subunit UvrA [Acidaminobacter sp. JC074]MCH4889834.1 excinuclease ABC subunit UvrA [Acidaminobacter sp. JC074]
MKIIVKDAYEHNLKHVDVEIPKNKITVFTGVSGSGKSSLCMDTIAAESRRELNDTFPSFVQQYLPKYGRPNVGIIENLPVTMILDQKKPSNSSRSTIGTYTDINAFLRLLFSRVGKPFVGYSDVFSFNHPKGRCSECEGLGEVTKLDIHKLVDFNKCLNDEGVINFPAFTTGAWRWKRYANSGLFDLNKKIKDYSEEELELFLHSPQVKLKDPPSNWPKSAKFEGIYPRMYRSIIYTKEGKRHKKLLDTMVTTRVCESCHGTRLNDTIRSCKINDKSISDILALPIPEIKSFLHGLKDPLADPIVDEINKRLQPLIDVGLSYLTLERGMGTLSGGEAQRVKISKYINSALTDVVYVLDEPSVGLHQHDIFNLKSSIEKLRDRGNTIMMVEHHPGIIQMADHVIDMGPVGGEKGGYVMYEGPYKALLEADTITSKMLKDNFTFKENLRESKDFISLRDLSHHNLKNISLEIPRGVWTLIAGVAGSGKSSLASCILDQLEKNYVFISQKSIGANSRSTPATYMGISDAVRKLYAKETGKNISYFSFNAKGACPVCKGKGIITTEMGFMDQIESVCESCNGKRYNNQVLEYKYKSHSIAQVFDLSVNEAIDFFDDAFIIGRLNDLEKVGLGYLHLNQSMSTLSGGELQRIKLASKLNQKGQVYVLDEPTDGLHLYDVRKLIHLFNAIVDEDNTLIVIDHHMDMLKSADHLIELGPKGGSQGGYLLFEGKPCDIVKSDESVTKSYI